MGIRREHLSRNVIHAEHVPANEIPWGDLKGLKIGTVSVGPGSVGAGASVNVDVSVADLTTSHRVLAMCQEELEAGLVPQAAYVPLDGTLRIRIYNPTAAAVTGAARTWFYLAWIP